MAAVRVLVLYNEPVLPADHPEAEAEHNIRYTVSAVSQALSTGGYEVFSVGVARDPAPLLEAVRRYQPQVVFNLFEGTAEQADNETYVTGLLHWLRLPTTGAPAETLALARFKPWTKHLLQGAGLPTPAGLLVEQLPVPSGPLAWPVIVKPACQDASLGVDQGSVVTSTEQLHQRVTLLVQRYGGPVLVEEYIPGRELVVGIIEKPERYPLPVSEILFREQRPGSWPIVTYAAKWEPASVDYQATPPRCPADLPAETSNMLQRLALKAFHLLRCRDYARVDFRLSPQGQPYILEVNPNPDLSPDAGLAGSLRAAGLEYAAFVRQLVANALARGPEGRCGLAAGR